MIFLLYPVQFEGNGLIAPEEFSAYKWMHENTDEKADVLIMFSPTNSQISKLYLIKRDLFVTKADQGVDDFRPISFYCKKEDCSLFKESRFLERRKELPRSLEFCDYEYVFIPLINYQEYSDANLAFAQGLVDINISTVVFNNPAVVILDVKDECENLI